MSRRVLAALAVLLVSLAPTTRAQLEVLETDSMRLIYLDPLHTFLVQHLARCFENSMQVQRELFDYEPTEKVTVILGDIADVGNAGAGAIPRNGMAVMIAPPSLAYETYPANERINTLMNHELVHVANFDQPSGSDSFFRFLLGGKIRAVADHPETIVYNYLTAPRASAPRWYHEGIAVFVETWMAGGIGRAQGSYDEMVFRSMVRDGTRFYDPLGLVSEGTSTDFQLEMNSYLYGARFVQYMAYTESPEKILEWTRRRGSKAHYAAQFERVFGRSLEDAWQEWVEFEHEFQSENLARLRTYPMTPFEDIATRGLGSVSRGFVDATRGKLYVGVNYPGSVSHIAAIDLQTGASERITDVKGPTLYTVTSLAFDAARDRLYYTTDNGSMRDIVELDPSTKKKQEILHDGRVGDLVVDPRDGALWGIRHDSGYATIVRVGGEEEGWDQIHTLPYGQFAFDLDASPDGSLLCAAVMMPDGRSEVRVVRADSVAVDFEDPVARFGFGTVLPMNFVFAPDGRSLVGSAAVTGVSNLFRYSIDSGEVEALTNTETGLYRPIPLDDDTVIAFRFTGEGFVPSRLTVAPLEDLEAIRLFGTETRMRRPELGDWNAGSPDEIDLDSIVESQHSYSPLASIELTGLVPIVEGYKDQTAVGLYASLSDPMGLHRLDASASYTPNEDFANEERLHLEVGYERYQWHLTYKLNDADFYDLAGPTKSSRKGWAVEVDHQRSLVDDPPRSLDLGIHAAYWGDLETLPDYQNVGASYDELLSGSVRLAYKHRRFSIGAVDYEKGSEGSFSLRDQHVNGRSYPSAVATMDFGVPAVISHSSIWLRSAAGVAPADRDEPFSNFYLGGFGNNYVDRYSVKRYRQWYAFPGFELNELSGTNFVKSMVDWNLPPIRFGGLGKPSLHAKWLRSSLFVAGLITNVDSSELRTRAASAGAQIDIRFSLLSHLDLTASVGYGFGFIEGRRNSNELMISLKVL